MDSELYGSPRGVTNYGEGGGYKTGGRWGACEVLPLRKVLAMLKGGGGGGGGAQPVFGVVLHDSLKF